MKRVVLIVATLVVAVGPVVACSGSSSGSSSATSVASKTVPGSEWADNMCKSLGSWEQTLRDQPQVANSTDAQQAKAAIVGYLERVDTATGNLITSIAQGGNPQIPQGSALVDAFVKELDRARSLFQDALAKARELPTNDTSKFRSEVRSLSSNIESGGQQIGNAISNLGQRYPAAGQAIQRFSNSVPSCKSLG